jgi:signal transduction histidine kinase
MAEPLPERPDAAVAGSAYLRHVCHELRQPLVVAVGYVSMLEDGSFGALPSEALAVLRTVAERLDAINGIIDELATDSPHAEL